MLKFKEVSTMEYITIKYKGQHVQCWGGALKEDDNIIMAYGDFEDAIENWNYKTDMPFKNWRDAVSYLIDLDRFGEIHQLEKC
jgi:hypothetical protein